MGWVILLVIVIVVAFVLQKIQTMGWSALNRHVFSRGNYADEKELTGSAISYRTTQPPSVVSSRVRDAVGAADAPIMMANLYLADASEHALTFKLGGKLGSAFEAALTFEPSGSGTEGRFMFLNWTETDGVMASAKQAGALRNSVVNALRDIDPQVWLEKTPVRTK